MLVTALLLVLGLVQPIDSSVFLSDRSFTVRESIEMNRFYPQGPDVSFSPNGRYFTCITSRGIISSNEIESTIWLFDSNKVLTFLRSGIQGQSTPTKIARWQSTPAIASDVSYESVISDLHWLPDSKTILFSAQNTNGMRTLYKATVDSGILVRLTPRGYDVKRYAWGHNIIVYETAPQPQIIPVGSPINGAAADITGLPLENILFNRGDDFTKYDDLWVMRDGKNRKLKNPVGARPIELLNHEPGVLAVSPDGRTAVTLLPVENVPNSWASYSPLLPSRRIVPKNSTATSRLNFFRLTEYTLVDLRTGTTKSMLGAPNATALGYDNANQVAWAPDSRHVLLTNTFLRLGGSETPGHGELHSPCIAVVVDITNGNGTCVVFGTGSYKQFTPLLDATFARESSEVDLEVLSGNTTVRRRYQLSHRHWRLVSSAQETMTSISSGHLSVEVRQGLNIPPALWATNQQTRTSKKLWDPNPQLGSLNLGKVSVLRWKDSSGYEWTGGLVKPPNYVAGKLYPLVIQTHGFDEDRFLSDGSFTTAFAARPLAAEGIVVLQMGMDLDHLLTAQESGDNVRGFASAIERLSSDGMIDPHRVGIIGFSRTCYYVEDALIRYPNMFAAATLSDGSDFSYMQYLLYAVDSPDAASEYDSIYTAKPFGKGLTTWLHDAPGFHLDRVRTPVRIEAIGAGSILSEWEIYASLRMQHKPVDFVYIPNGQHIMQAPLDRLASQQGNVDWFRFWLQGYEDPDPMKAAQYKRWEILRKLQDINGK